MSEVILKLKEDFPYTELQKLWIKQLKSYPKRQTKGTLGEGTPKKYKACCLGEGVLCIHRIEGTELPFKKFEDDEFFIIVNDNEKGSRVTGFPSTLQAEKLGLFTTNGEFYNKEILPEFHWVLSYSYNSLSTANDGDISWPKIAELMEKFPEVVFNNLETK